MLNKKAMMAAPATVPLYVEDVFSTWLYTGNGSTQTITNGIDLAGEGGLVWIKERSNVGFGHFLFDNTSYADGKALSTNTTSAYTTDTYNGNPARVSGFNLDGFDLGWPDRGDTTVNYTNATYASWTFRKAPKFFDVVTYTGTGANRTIAHNLGSVPGMIIVKRTDTTGDWQVYHRSLANTEYLVLNTTNAKATGATRWNSTTPTASVFSLGTDATVNASGGTYVAYLFAHDAGGFGDSGTDSIVACGGFTVGGDGSATVTLGWEPQFVLSKLSNSTSNWTIIDIMRGNPVEGQLQRGLYAELNIAEGNAGGYGHPTSTGMRFTGWTSGNEGIYLAIRRPMKPPTSGTEVFSTVARTGTGSAATVTSGFPIDMYLMQRRPTASFPNIVDRLRGNTRNIQTYQSGAETAATSSNTITGLDSMTGARLGADTDGYVNESGITYVNQLFRRAPKFFDVVCYTGTGVARTVAHNLTVAPELMIVKCRSVGYTWDVYSSFLGTSYTGALQNNAAFSQPIPSSAIWNNTAPTSTLFSVGTTTSLNESGSTYVAYLFATLPGVSKVGSYTGTGTTLSVDCGFTAGARFVLIKRTDDTGGWYVWDTARGIVSGDDPYLFLNSTAAEVTNTDYIDPLSSGFEISSTAPAGINASGGSFIFLAVA